MTFWDLVLKIMQRKSLQEANSWFEYTGITGYTRGTAKLHDAKRNTASIEPLLRNPGVGNFAWWRSTLCIWTSEISDYGQFPFNCVKTWKFMSPSWGCNWTQSFRANASCKFVASDCYGLVDLPHVCSKVEFLLVLLSCWSCALVSRELILWWLEQHTSVHGGHVQPKALIQVWQARDATSQESVLSGSF